MNPGDIVPTDLFSPEDLERIVTSKLPGWKRACASSEADAIVLHELAFGMSGGELLLFACALKYAAQKGKNVHVVCGRADGAKAIEAPFLRPASPASTGIRPLTPFRPSLDAIALPADFRSPHEAKVRFHRTFAV